LLQKYFVNCLLLVLLFVRKWVKTEPSISDRIENCWDVGQLSRGVVVLSISNAGV
jgi:hypothetical protein